MAVFDIDELHSEDPYENLAISVVMLAVEDVRLHMKKEEKINEILKTDGYDGLTPYEKRLIKNREDAESFFKSDDFELFYDLDGSWILNRLLNSKEATA